MKKKLWNVHKIEGAHLQYVNNHLAKFEWKGIKTFGSYRLHKLGTPKVLRAAKCLSSTPLKNEKKIMKRAQNRRCTSSICEQSFGKVRMKRNKNFWSYRLHKLGTPKVFRTDRRTDGRSGPNTRPAFAKARQVKIIFSEPNSFMHMFNVSTLYRQNIKLLHQKLW